MFKRLAGQTGEIADSSVARPSDEPGKIVRSAILIHSGPNGEQIDLESSDGDISFDAARIQRVVDNQNKMIADLVTQYGGFDQMPIGAWPPILDQHSDDSNDRIRGRLTGILRFETRSVPKVGDNVACAICDITFLGVDTCDQVKDGRIYHLSVGIDENSDTLGEVSTVIEPAAPGAMLLSKKRLAKKRLEKKTKSKGESKMSAKNLAKLKALSGELAQLSKNSKNNQKLVKLAKRQNEVKSRFMKLMSAKKMTPAEFKLIDVKRLAKLDKESFEDVMHVYDARQATVKSGQMGSASAANFTDVATTTAEDREVKRLKAAVKKNMKLSGTKFLAADEDEDKKDLAADDKELSADEKKDMKKRMAADDSQSESDSMGEDGHVDDEAGDDEQSEMMQKIEENAAQIARVATMVQSLIEEIHGEDSKDDDSAADEGDDEESDSDEKDEKDLEKGDEANKDKKEGK